MPPQNAKYFLVASHGWSASNWVAYALNLHPQITCAHSSAALVASDPGLFSGNGLKRHIPQLRSGYARRHNCSLLNVYSGLEEQTSAPFVGTVHTYRLRDLPLQTDRFPQRSRTFRTSNLVRHPLDLVISGYGQFQELFLLDVEEFSWTLNKIVGQGLDIVENICRRHEVTPGSLDSLCFFGACVALGSLRQDLDALETVRSARGGPWDYQGIVRMEDVTRSPEAMASLIERLTGQSGLASPDYLEKVYRQGRINTHNQRASRGVIQRWVELEEWKRDAFAQFLQHFDLRDAYEGFGYDFGFLDDWSRG